MATLLAVLDAIPSSSTTATQASHQTVDIPGQCGLTLAYNELQ